MAIQVGNAREEPDGKHRTKRKRNTERRNRRRTKGSAEETKEDENGQKSLNLSMIQELPKAVQRRTQVKPFVEHTLTNGVAKLIAEFRSMKRSNDFSVMTEFVAQIPQGRNRYKDVGCLDFQRVVINIGPVSYIHANYVSTPGGSKRFICTQAPLPKTCADFWYMIVQEKTTAIVMLCNFIEQNSKKSAMYLPLTPEESPMTFEGVVVKLKKQEQFQFPIPTKVSIRVTHLEVRAPGEPPHLTTHYHWQDWPDRGVPEADLAPICLLSKIRKTVAPIVVHCSAGIGRTGSIVLIMHALELLQNKEPLPDIRSLLLLLRKQRNNSIQTEHQYLYVHQVLLIYLKRMKYLDESVNPYLDKFTTDYVEATRGF